MTSGKTFGMSEKWLLNISSLNGGGGGLLGVRVGVWVGAGVARGSETCMGS